MADVTSAARWIGKLLADEAEYLAKVADKVKGLQDELEWMQCFLRDADASQLDNSMARKWVAQIREFAYEAEDVVEKFLVNSRGGGHDFMSKLRKYLRMFLRVVDIHMIGKDIDALKEKISFLTDKLHTYGIQLRLGDSSSSWLSMAKNETYFTFKEETLVGRNDYMKILLHDLVPEKIINVGSSQPSSSTTNLMKDVITSISERGEPDSEQHEAEREIKVVSIYGMGGIGKSFIANKIFNHPDIRRSYDAFAWASISQPCQMSAVQQELLGCLTSKSRIQIAQMTNDELEHQLRRVQRRKKCFIVLDGFWKRELWDQLKDAFPGTCRGFKTTVLITTRVNDVPKYVHPGAVVQELKMLNPDHSKKLLSEKVGDGLKHEPDGLRDRMLNKCGGLPLAIAVLGGILAKKKTPDDWKALEKKFNSYWGEKVEQPWKRILDLSFYDLPYQLKPCFLYLSYFPTNLELTTTKLSRLWEAEGLVSSGDNEESEETLGDVAENFLAELVERSLVHVASRDLEGRAKTCRLHEVMQNICMDKALKVNWLSVLQLGDKTDESSGNSSNSRKSLRSTRMRKSRRLAIYCTEKLNKLPSDYRQASYVRSLLFFNTLNKDDFLIPLEKKALQSTFELYKLIRVLDIENIGLTSLPKNVGSLIHLRYLSLRGSWVSQLPSSIKYLTCLQTLDLRVLSFVRMRIPNVLVKLKQLVHLYLPVNPLILENEAPNLQLEGLLNLETLSNFSSKLCRADDLGTLKNLREFASCDYLSAQESILPLLPGSELIHLDYISLRLDGLFLSSHPRALAGCKALQKLWVKGKIPELVSHNFLPKDIYKLCLSGLRLLQDPMPILEKLTQLKELSLEHSSYEGTSMRCSKEGFKQLQCLNVERLESLEEWIIEEDAMQKLFSLEINRCLKLKMVPNGLKFVKSLRELRIMYMPLSFYKGWTPVKSRTKWDEYWKVEHVPHVYISKVLDLQTTNHSSSSDIRVAPLVCATSDRFSCRRVNVDN